jgi:hypothetical protein
LTGYRKMALTAAASDSIDFPSKASGLKADLYQ